MPTLAEQGEHERPRAEQERKRAEQAEGQLVQAARFRDGYSFRVGSRTLRESLLAQGMPADQVAQLLGLSVAQVEALE